MCQDLFSCTVGSLNLSWNTYISFGNINSDVLPELGTISATQHTNAFIAIIFQQVFIIITLNFMIKDSPSTKYIIIQKPHCFWEIALKENFQCKDSFSSNSYRQYYKTKQMEINFLGRLLNTKILSFVRTTGELSNLWLFKYTKAEKCKCNNYRYFKMCLERRIVFSKIFLRFKFVHINLFLQVLF